MLNLVPYSDSESSHGMGEDLEQPSNPQKTANKRKFNEIGEQ